MTAAPSLYTFDVFDTLLTRIWLKPAHVFLHTGHVLQQRGLFDRGADEWRDVRVTAEAALRRRPKIPEVELGEIYQDIRQRLGWTQEQAQLAMSVELDCEKVVSRPITPMLARALSYCSEGASVAYVSDFYVGSSFVAKLLERAGVRTESRQVFVSCDERATKRSGALFHAVAARCHTRPSAILHTGDHEESDVRKAREAGLAVRPFRSGRANESELALVAGDAGAVSARLTASALAGAARRARLSRELRGRDAEIWRVATGVAGPLLFGYVRWVLAEAHARGVRRLYFLARDGQILKRVAEQMLPGLGLDLELRYLYASRRAWLLAAVAGRDATEQSLALTADDSVDMESVLGRIGVDRATVHHYLRERKISIDALSTDARRQALRTMLITSPFDAALRTQAVEEASLAEAYFRQEGLFDGQQVAIVDIGWKGRLQGALSRLLRAGGSAVQPVGFYLGLRETPPRDQAGETLAYLRGAAGRAVNPSLAELFCAADHGTLLGYERSTDGTILPLLAAARDEDALGWGLELLQEGIVEFTAKMTDAYEVLLAHDLLCPQTLRDAGVRAIERLVSRPSRAEADLLGAFPHSDNQYHTDMTELAPTVSPATLLRAFLKPTSLAKRTYWQQATVARSTPAARMLLTLWRTRIAALPRLRKQLGW